jgi:hypothetical protein
MRATRDLLRRRTYFVRKRAELLAHLQMTFLQYNLAPPAQKLRYAANRAALDLDVFPDPSTRTMLAADLTIVTALDGQIKRLEADLVRTAKVHDPQTFHRLRTVPGIGPVLALILLYEVHDLGRFADEGRFLSYARLVSGVRESAGKKKGTGGRKIGKALEVGLLRNDLSAHPVAAQRQGLAGTARTQARQEAGARRTGRPPGPDRLPPVAQEGGVRRQPLPRELVAGRAPGSRRPNWGTQGQALVGRFFVRTLILVPVRAQTTPTPARLDWAAGPAGDDIE